MPVRPTPINSNEFYALTPPPPTEVVGTGTGSSPRKQLGPSVPKSGGVDALTNVEVLSHVRNAVVENFDANYIPNLDAPLGATVAEEMEVFSSTFGGRLEGASEQTKYARLIQNIQARFKNGGFTYTVDRDSEGVPDYWSSPTEVLADSGKEIDCEDFAFMIREYGESVKEELGIGGRFVAHGGLVNHDRTRGHAVCVYHADDGNQYVIDGTEYASGAGDISRVETVAEYTEEHNFQWIVSSDGNLRKLEFGTNGPGSRSFQSSDYVADLDAEGKPADVLVVENNAENISYAEGVKDQLDAEPAGFKGIMNFFGEKREGLLGLSLLELGSLVMGPLVVIGDALKIRSENSKLSSDRRLEKTSLGSRVQDRNYHRTKLAIAAIKGVLDTARYVAFIVICAGVGALAAPIVVLAVSALRCGVGAVETLRTTAKKFTRLRRRNAARKEMSTPLGECHPEARGLLKSRIQYKIRKARLSASWIFGAFKSFAFAGTGVGMIVTASAALLGGTLLAVNPVILGVALGFAVLLGVIRTAQLVYNGVLLREQKTTFRSGKSLIDDRLNRIRGKDQRWYSRIGASLNLFGWVTDAVDDRIATLPVAAQWAIKALLAPFYLVTFLTESKTFNEEAVLSRLREEFAREDVSAEERTALLKSTAAYYEIPEDDILLKWMTPGDLNQLQAYADTSKKPTSPIAERYLRTWLKSRESFEASDHQEIVKFRTNALNLVKVKFAGGYGVA